MTYELAHAESKEGMTQDEKEVLANITFPVKITGEGILGTESGYLADIAMNFSFPRRLRPVFREMIARAFNAMYFTNGKEGMR